jgi:hypothetical protein
MGDIYFSWQATPFPFRTRRRIMFPSERKTLDKFLHSLSYPLGRGVLVEDAEKANLPVQFMGMLQRLEDRKYQSVEDVEATLAAHKA